MIMIIICEVNHNRTDFTKHYMAGDGAHRVSAHRARRDSVLQSLFTHQPESAMALYNTDQLATIAAKIKHVKFGMFTTLDDHYKLSSRPLTHQQIDDNGAMWFFVSDQEAYTRNLDDHPSVNVSFADTSDSLYLSVAGQAEL